jgi:hypothetical protein
VNFFYLVWCSGTIGLRFGLALHHPQGAQRAQVDRQEGGGGDYYGGHGGGFHLRC